MLTTSTKAEAQRLMLQADRDRARLMYDCPDRVLDNERLWQAHQRRVRATVEYREAQARFDHYAGLISTAGPRDLARLLP